VPSNVLFDMSVEWPTAITAAYSGASDYTQATQYEGLFDPNLCYDYDSSLGNDATPPVTPAGGFVPKATAVNHGCTGRWSGNFLNWATMTGLDEFRYATTGGNRVVDETARTVLERTYISANGGRNDDPGQPKSCAGTNDSAYFKLKCINPTTGQFTQATPYTDNTTFTFDNLAKGIGTTVSWTTTTTVTTPHNTNATTTCNGSWSGTPLRCSLFQATVDGTTNTGTCATWAGTGTSVNPYKCTAFNSFGTTVNVAPAITATTCSGTRVSGKYYCSSYATNFVYNTTSTSTNNFAPFFNVRVKACDKTYPLRDNCQQYSSGYYKPVGEIQRNGEKMRFGVFAYYNADDIDNAVMRARLKYVAPNKFSSAASTIDNANKEWDPDTGVLKNNPDASDATNSYASDGPGSKSPVANSGVINYLNKFGSTTQSYKSFDNISKMYYESLRYLRKLSPTTDFYQNAKISGNDGFPIITDWYKGGTDDPMPYYCQRNYIITMGDQFTHCDKRLPGGSLTPYYNHTTGTNGDWCGTTANPSNVANDQDGLTNGDTLNVTNLTNTIGGFEGLGALGTARTGAGGNASYYMAGLAHWAATNDIRPDLKNALSNENVGGFERSVEKPQTVKTFVIDVEENQRLAANTYIPGGAYRSQFWYTAKYGGGGGDLGYYKLDTTGQTVKLATSGELDGTKWSKGNATYSTSKESYTGDWPKTLLQAGNPASMIASIKEALATVNAETGTNSALSQSSGDLRTQTEAFVYRATFQSAIWSGELEAKKINANGEINATPEWSASKVLPLPGSRQIVTFNDGLKPDNTKDTVTTRGPMAFDPAKFTNLSARQRDFLGRNGNGVVETPNRGDKRMAYLRGDSSYEPNHTPGGFFGATDDPKEAWRSRTITVGTTPITNKLGDIINSNPIYVARPDPDLSGKEYNLFAQSVKDRKPMIYVGANDGMLHGFDASDGKELIAYVPSAVYSRLSQLTSESYSHKYFVDGTPTVGEACKGSCTGKDDWMTVLVGGLNAGGQGIYALDVTDPTKFASAQSSPSSVVMWEFTDRDDADLGYTFSRPVVARMNNGKWAVVFGNGFNNTAGDGKFSSTGRAYLYVLPIDGPGSGSWILGNNYYKIELKAPDETGTPLNPANGLASVNTKPIDRDLDGTVDLFYAGDRRGNLWKIDVSSANPANWKSAFGTASAPQPLFSATHTTGSTTTPQSITTGVDVSPHPNGGFMVTFGTGSFIEATDGLAPFNTDSFYGIWDKDDATATSEGTKVARDKLQRQKVTKSIDSNGKEYLFVSSCRPNFNDVVVDKSNVNGDLCPSDIAYPVGTGQQLGWVLDLPGDGERVASDVPFLQSGILTLTTLQPSADPCAGDTIGRGYYLNYLTGGAPSKGVFDLNGDGLLNNLDLISADGTTGSSTGIAPAGVVYNGGASKTPAVFYRNKPTSSGSTGSTTHACPDFIPGWGCQSELTSGRSFLRWRRDVISNAGGTPPFDVFIPGSSGRLTWRQIVK
jgi:type IV pilus assembly protein PilY1